MLDQAGITDSTTQLEINVILNAWCLCVAVGGTCKSSFAHLPSAQIVDASSSSLR